MTAILVSAEELRAMSYQKPLPFRNEEREHVYDLPYFPNL